jgi:hypothetical protein
MHKFSFLFIQNVPLHTCCVTITRTFQKNQKELPVSICAEFPLLGSKLMLCLTFEKYMSARGFFFFLYYFSPASQLTPEVCMVNIPN